MKLSYTFVYILISYLSGAVSVAFLHVCLVPVIFWMWLCNANIWIFGKLVMHSDEDEEKKKLSGEQLDTENAAQRSHGILMLVDLQTTEQDTEQPETALK